MRPKNGLPPVHPGEIIKNDILPETGLSVTAAAKLLGVSRQMLHDILAGRKPLSAIMCVKVARLFGSSPDFWMRLQATHDLKKAEQDKSKVIQNWWRQAGSKRFVFREVSVDIGAMLRHKDKERAPPYGAMAAKRAPVRPPAR